MGLQINIKMSTFEDNFDGPDAVRSYLNDLQTQTVMFLNGPESPGPCLRCLMYHRTIWKKSDSKRPRPPLHPHCYCRTVSHRKKDVDQPMTKYKHLQNSIAKLSLRERALLMGKGIARLHRLGIVETKDLVSTASGIRTLKELLKNKLNIDIKVFNKLSDGDLINLFNEVNK